jgi:high-affinity nickel permease
VVLVAAAVAGTAGALGAVEGLGQVGGVIATGVSVTFLLAGRRS